MSSRKFRWVSGLSDTPCGCAFWCWNKSVNKGHQHSWRTINKFSLQMRELCCLPGKPKRKIALIYTDNVHPTLQSVLVKMQHQWTISVFLWIKPLSSPPYSYSHTHLNTQQSPSTCITSLGHHQTIPVKITEYNISQRMTAEEEQSVRQITEHIYCVQQTIKSISIPWPLNALYYFPAWVKYYSLSAPSS